MDIKNIGASWVVDTMEGITHKVTHMSPVEFNEGNRYLPKSVTSMPGYIRYSVNPFMREIVECFDVNSDVREVNLMKGVQITYSTVLESGAFYYMGHVKSLPIMYMTADKELASARIENNFIPMLQHSGFAHIVRSSDEGNSRKTGKTANHIQFQGGGYLVPFGAKNADKMRSYSIAVMLKDEIDAWPLTVGNDGDPDKLSDDRCSAYWERRKIFRGSTPLIKSTSKIWKAYQRGDQRVYKVRCKACNFPQELRWSRVNKETGIHGGFNWETDGGILLPESVCYCCVECGEKHFEYDKERLFSEDDGAMWTPTAKPKMPGIRSYHLPALYSPIGMQPWYKSVATYLDSYDDENKKVKDIEQYQVFYNNVLGMPFEVVGNKIAFTTVSAHRRTAYGRGMIPNKFAIEWSGSPILMLTCQVDVHKDNLAVAVMGWTRGNCCYLIDYWRLEVEGDEADCTDPNAPVLDKLRAIISELRYEADDGKRYWIGETLIDAGYANDTVCHFCAGFDYGVFPVLGRDRVGRNQRIKEFDPFTTQVGTQGFKILVDHYKDRMNTVLRRQWQEGATQQADYHFNAPIDMSDKELKELNTEYRKEQQDDRGNVSYIWYRSSGARNELWDLLGYGYAAVDIVAWDICVRCLDLDSIDWDAYWEYLEVEKLYYDD